MQKDTIAAVATPPGRGGIAIIRISGPQAQEVLNRVFKPRYEKIRPRRLIYGDITDNGKIVDEALAVFMYGSRTYTAEDTAELHCHGGIVVTERTLALCMQAGCRPALAGEFTKRAFLNGRIDLTRAEAVMDIISASSELAAKAAVNALSGRLAERIYSLQDSMTDILSAIEAAIDYPEEVELDENIFARAEGAASEIAQLLCRAKAGAAVREGVSIAIAGRPNVGKSSLMNALLDAERSIVTEIAGTTRDIIEDTAQIDGLAVRLIDTAGLRHTEDIIEAEGVRRAREAVAGAAAVLLVFDAGENLSDLDITLMDELIGQKVLPVVNKTDKPALIDTQPIEKRFGEVIRVSALTGEGIESLKRRLRDTALGQSIPEGELLLTRQRHIHALKNAHEALCRLAETKAIELLAQDVRYAWRELGSITGQTADSAVIDRIFESFCVGK